MPSICSLFIFIFFLSGFHPCRSDIYAIWPLKHADATNRHPRNQRHISSPPHPLHEAATPTDSQQRSLLLRTDAHVRQRLLAGAGGRGHEADGDEVREVPAHEILGNAGAGRQVLARESAGVGPQRPRRVGVVQLRRYGVARQVRRREVEESEPVLMTESA